MPGVPSLAVCVESWAKPLKGSVPLMLLLPGSCPAPELPRRGGTLLSLVCLGTVGDACTGNLEAGDEHGLC